VNIRHFTVRKATKKATVPIKKREGKSPPLPTFQEPVAGRPRADHVDHVVTALEIQKRGYVRFEHIRGFG
jgi:hypothetical protein